MSILLQKYVGADLIVTFRQRCNRNESTSGYVLDANDSCVLVFQFADFNANGYAILRTADVISATPDPNRTRILQGEGFHSDSALNPSIPIDSIKRAICGLYVCHENIVIHCDECDDAEEAGFHIGRITAALFDSMKFLYFDTGGNWFNTPYRIPYKSITRIEFRTPYITTFSKYVTQCPIGP